MSRFHQQYVMGFVTQQQQKKHIIARLLELI